MVFDDVGEYADHQLVGYELAFVDVFFGGFAELGSFGDMAAEHFAGGDMVYAVTFDEFCALRPFAAAGCAEYYDVEHLIGVWWFIGLLCRGCG